MSNFKFNPNDKQNGKVVYNAGIVNGIVALAVEEVEGTTLVSGKRRGHQPLHRKGRHLCGRFRHRPVRL